MGGSPYFPPHSISLRQSMQLHDISVLERRQARFDRFYEELMPALVDFVERVGIKPGHGVLNQAPLYVEHLTTALSGLTVSSDEDRIWLLARVSYFIGEYLVQKYSGYWYVNDIEGSRYFARYVVGRFSALNNLVPMVDPFEVAQVFVDTPPPRQLDALLGEVESELAHMSKTAE
jgi:hypothetical protein